MAAKRKTKKGLENLTDLLTRLEKEAEKVVHQLRLLAEQTSEELRTSIRGLVSQIRHDGLYSVASEKTENLRELVDDVIERAREIQSGTFSKDFLIQEARKNLEDLVERFQASELVLRARSTARQTKRQLLTALSIPSESDVEHLSRKIAHLEDRIKKLSRKAA
ncbi:MAG: hypothetical protein HYW02_07905 [Deltaproteobacteria bacterium]|nr:hypothetical protein [Deltaproteobacteria bacterium]MBI2501360.1 hypothetical protein [Deltaproteobacteria bacterium]MBI4197353.1 hypothetical protein [Deltaproteobacteria bacterium]